MISALVKYYEALLKEDKVPPIGWSRVGAKFAIELSSDGDVIGIIPLWREKIIERGKKKKTEEIPRKVDVPVQLVRGNNPIAYFLCDNTSYLLGFNKDGNSEKALERFALSKEQHLEILKDNENPIAVAIRNFYTKWDPKKYKDYPAIIENSEKLLKSSNIVFYIDGKFAHEDKEMISLWNEYYNTHLPEDVGICLATGKKARIPKIHAKIKAPGGQASGTSLIAYNIKAANSYGKEQNLNAPVGEYAAHAYINALNYLINNDDDDAQNPYSTKTREKIGDTIILFWPEHGSEVYQQGMMLCRNPSGDNQKIVKNIFENIGKSHVVDVDGVLKNIDPNEKFYILGVSPNGGRLSVRFFHVNHFGNLLKNLKEHYERMAIIRPGFDKYEYISNWQLIQEAARAYDKDKKVPDHISGALMRSILENRNYPEGFYHEIMNRIRATTDDKEKHIYKITRGRVAFIKAYLLKNKKINKEVLTVGLNENCKDIPYVLGRLFAVLEGAQEKANPEINATIKDRYFNSACATPAAIFPVLLKLKNSHIRKLEDKNKIFFEKKLQELISIVDSDGFPKKLSLDEQGLFVIGYYHETQKRYEKKDTEENINE